MLVSTVGTVLERFHSKPKVNNTQRSGLIIVIRLTRAYSYIKHIHKIYCKDILSLRFVADRQCHRAGFQWPNNGVVRFDRT